MPATIWMPPAIEVPAIVEPVGMLELFADGGIIRFNGVLSETVLYRRYGTERHGVARIIMLRQSEPGDGFDLSLVRAYVQAVGERRH
jgi:hypothetical protein